MTDKETIFKEAIRNRLDDQLKNIGYKKYDESKGFIKYVCSNNNLQFVFEWNQTYDFYCTLSFNRRKILGYNLGDEFDYDYPFESVVQRLEKNEKIKEPVFGREFTVRIEEWADKISSNLSRHKFQEIKNNHPVIELLRKEKEEETKKYNQDRELSQTKRNADKAWSEKDFKTYNKIMRRKTVELPPLYDKKLSIAIKKIEKENGA